MRFPPRLLCVGSLSRSVRGEPARRTGWASCGPMARDTPSTPQRSSRAAGCLVATPAQPAATAIHAAIATTLADDPSGFGVLTPLSGTARCRPMVAHGSSRANGGRLYPDDDIGE